MAAETSETPAGATKAELTEVTVAAHFPLTLTDREPRCDLYTMDVAADECVADFKIRFSALCNIPVSELTLCYGGEIRPDDGCIWREALVPPAGKDKVVLHVRVEDPELQRQVAARLAKGSLFVPVESVTMRAA